MDFAGDQIGGLIGSGILLVMAIGLLWRSKNSPNGNLLFSLGFVCGLVFVIFMGATLIGAHVQHDRHVNAAKQQAARTTLNNSITDGLTKQGFQVLSVDSYYPWSAKLIGPHGCIVVYRVNHFKVGGWKVVSGYQGKHIVTSPKALLCEYN